MDEIICKGARIMYLHPCYTTNQHFTAINSIAINSIVCDKATFQVATIFTMLQTNFHPLSRCHVTANVNNRCHMSSARSKTKLSSTQRRRNTSSSTQKVPSKS